MNSTCAEYGNVKCNDEKETEHEHRFYGDANRNKISTNIKIQLKCIKAL